jgi:transmembrane sensor
LALHEAPASTAPARSSRIVFAIAATLVLSVGSLAWWRATPVRYQAAPSVASTSIALGDGSVVSLARGATLTVPRSLGWPAFLRSASRDVQLQGVAFFTVARDGRPFLVHTTDAAVRVLGTRFEVRGPTAVSGTRVAVEEGRVQVTARPTRQAVTLGAGDRTVIGAAALTVTTVAPDRVATWREGGLAAVDEPLGVVLAELARRYETPITLVDAVAARAMVSLFYTQAPTLETVLTDLCTAQGLRFSRTSDGYVVQRAP